MSEDCIFCKIINGDFNTEFVYENEYVVVFKDINPKAPIVSCSKNSRCIVKWTWRQKFDGGIIDGCQRNY